VADEKIAYQQAAACCEASCNLGVRRFSQIRRGTSCQLGMRIPSADRNIGHRMPTVKKSAQLLCRLILTIAAM
jgi:hypothetical protein